jgi:hypothetical protein
MNALLQLCETQTLEERESNWSKVLDHCRSSNFDSSFIPILKRAWDNDERMSMDKTL